MTTRTATLHVEPVTIPDAVGIAPQTVAALPPDEDQAAAGEIHVYINRTRLIIREYDPERLQP